MILSVPCISCSWAQDGFIAALEMRHQPCTKNSEEGLGIANVSHSLPTGPNIEKDVGVVVTSGMGRVE